MSFYRSNAICEHLRITHEPPFFVPEEASWLLVYGDNTCIPKVLAFVKSCKRDDINAPNTKKEEEAVSYFNKISEKSFNSIKQIQIRFDGESNEVDTVHILNQASEWEKWSLNKLSEYFNDAGLPLSEKQTGKAINDKSSSAYHDWQRKSLGNDLVVSDVDILYKTDEMFCIFELKRSFYDITDWAPYKQDYNNFKLLLNTCNPEYCNLFILYNKRNKSPFVEYIDKLALFKLEMAKGELKVGKRNIISMNDLINFGSVIGPLL